MERVIYITTMICASIALMFMFYIDSNNYKYHPYDVNHDGKVNITDYKIIKDYIQKEGN